MALRLHNTLSRRKEDFAPLDAKHVRMYVCGPTVYDLAHIGNARPVVVFDVLYRLLKRQYPRVTYVRNITDVDDKIMDAAKASGAPIDAITTKNTSAFHADMAALGCLPPDVEPRATAHIAEMQSLIRTLIDTGNAYVADGHVLFSVPSKPDYGKLSGRTRDEQIAGARVEVAPYKKDAADFVLWKPSTPDQPGWDSPWGRGRPGWHIECSAMSEKHLGVPFDIHGGGLDLVFPHHENEIAQSECAHGGAPFAKYWMHNGWLTVNGEKMSKSLGNFFTVRDLLAKAPGEAIRLMLLKTHYRAPLDFTEETLVQAKTELDRFYKALQMTGTHAASPDDPPPQEVLDALSDDLNTPQAITELHQLANRVFHAMRDEKPIPQVEPAMLAAGQVLGILRHDPDEWFEGPISAEMRVKIQTLVNEMDAARRAKDYEKADEARETLRIEYKVSVSNTATGHSAWRRN
jgi:cysteinyl-tRNA synthetase